MFFSGSVMEPSFGEKLFKWEVPSSRVAWGSFADMLRALQAGLQPGPWLLGDQFSAADVVVGSSARFGHIFGVIPPESSTAEYVARLESRPAFERAAAIEAEHLA